LNGQYASNDAGATNTTTTFASVITLTFTPPIAGTYIIKWTMEMTSSSNNKSVRAQVLLDTATTIGGIYEYVPTAAGNYMPWSGFYETTLTAASHTIDIQFAIGTGPATATIRNARIAAIRLA